MTRNWKEEFQNRDLAQQKYPGEPVPIHFLIHCYFLFAGPDDHVLNVSRYLSKYAVRRKKNKKKTTVNILEFVNLMWCNNCCKNILLFLKQINIGACEFVLVPRLAPILVNWKSDYIVRPYFCAELITCSYDVINIGTRTQ